MKLKPLSYIRTIHFFDQRQSCIDHYRNIHWSKKALSLIISFGTLFTYSLNRVSLKVRRAERKMKPLTSNAGSLSKKKLVVCLHGLNNNPTQFKKIVRELQKKDLSETDIHIPHILKKGNATLDEMANKIYLTIKTWAETQQECELVLVGISNGGRIAKAIEAKLSLAKHDNIKKLRFVSIVGACKGSSLVDLANRYRLSWLMSKNIAKEMPAKSERNRQLQEEWAQGLHDGPAREYIFIASPHDWQVIDYESSLMEVNGKKARYAIIPGHGHNSIVNAVSKTVADIIANP